MFVFNLFTVLTKVFENVMKFNFFFFAFLLTLSFFFPLTHHKNIFYVGTYNMFLFTRENENKKLVRRR